LLFGTGLLTTLVAEYFCFFHARRLPPNHDEKSCALPDFELWWTAAYGNVNPPKLPAGKGGGTINLQVSVPKSVGTVRLAPNGSEDVKVDPIVDPKYLSAIEDREMYRRGLLFVREVAKEMANEYAIEEFQYPDSFTPDGLDAYIEKFGMSGQHFLASCPMKPLAERGVVDQELKVYGINRLRIADGSVLPRMIASRPQATVAMIGERCADFIRQGWKRDKLFSPE
jgi:choline dehydrogenase